MKNGHDQAWRQRMAFVFDSPGPVRSHIVSPTQRTGIVRGADVCRFGAVPVREAAPILLILTEAARPRDDRSS
jgi:hypothetical protein